MTPDELIPVRPSVAQAVITGVATALWYAMPDLVRSRPARVALKLGLIGAGGAGWVLARPEQADPVGPQGPDVFDEVFEAVRSKPAESLGIGASVVGLSAVIGVLGEKAIFRFGERRRARGVRGAHLVPAIVLGVLGAVTARLP